MAKLFDSASLVMIPSGVKDDKLYSIKPTNGSGDFTFSRDGSGASPATRVGADGYIEKGRTNEILQSNQFDTTWTTTNASVTSGQSDKDGGTDAWLIDKSAASGRINQTSSLSGVQTLSVYAKAGTLDWILLYLDPVTGTDPTCYFDLANGVIGTSSSSVIDSNIESVGSGWYRCSITANVSNAPVLIFPADGDGDTSGTSGNIVIMNAMLEQSMVATDYIETTTAAVSAGLLGDMPRLDYSGGASCPSLLLEPSRVNSVTQSEYFGDSAWTKNDVTLTANDAASPEGVDNAYKIETTTGGSISNVNDTIYKSANTDYSFSVFVKAGNVNRVLIGQQVTGVYSNNIYDLSTETWVVTGSGSPLLDAQDYGNGWYRLTVSMDSGVSAANYQNWVGAIDNDGTTSNDTTSGNYIYAYGAQFEDGSYPTSYIPCMGSASTRGADYMDVNPSTLLGSDKGTWFLELDDLSFEVTGTTVPTIYLGDSGNDNLALVGRNVNFEKDVYLVREESGTSLTMYNYTITGNSKIAFSWDGSSIKVFVDGSLEYSATDFAGFSAWDSFVFNNASREAFSEIKQTLLFPTALTDAECINLTTL